MEEKKQTFVAYLDDDDTKKEVWCDILEETTAYIVFRYKDEQITIPYHRVLKVKRVGGEE